MEQNNIQKSPKLHRVLVELTIRALISIFNDNRYADKVIEQTLKVSTKFGARDRAFLAESIYDIVRWYRLLCFASNESEKAPNFWRVFAAWRIINGYDLPTDWQEFSKIDIPKLKLRLQEAQTIRKIRCSIPDWIDEIGEKELGENWDKELEVLNTIAPVVLRTNHLKISTLDLQKRLEKEDILTDTLPDVPAALVLRKRTNVFALQAFKEGLFEIQDAASQLVAPFLDIKEGMRVVDACAGAGGKALHLSTLMHNKGSVIAMDVEQWKLDELKKRARRNGCNNIEPRLIEGSKTIKRLHDSADRLLLDVPCSGLGVLRRNPDTKWKIKADFLDKIRQTQAEIILEYSKIVKKGGKMLYATCSILPSESEEQIRNFLAANKEMAWELLAEKRISPADTGYDGFYMACLQRTK